MNRPCINLPDGEKNICNFAKIVYSRSRLRNLYFFNFCKHKENVGFVAYSMTCFTQSFTHKKKLNGFERSINLWIMRKCRLHSYVF